MERYGLIGFPLGHSFSMSFFNEKFRNEHIDAEYVNFEIPTIEHLTEIVNATPNLRGLNVTIPYKEQVIPYLDELSEEAAAVGAVNLIAVSYKGRKVHLKGYNSDVTGFTNSIAPLLAPHHSKALILGTGGAAKAVDYSLQKLGLYTQMVSRIRRTNAITYEDINAEMMAEYHVVVNCTPLGLYPNTDECPYLPYEALTPHHLLYDLLYNPDTTLFMKKGAQQGAVVKNGLEMLLLQAYANWDVWHRDS
ncbi:MAG: shikimate dehydrogenase [Bacteroidaceae bacterium]|nr:shikimate dehydrogenase [Bacteroidaceae bacterium]